MAALAVLPVGLQLPLLAAAAAPAMSAGLVYLGLHPHRDLPLPLLMTDHTQQHQQQQEVVPAHHLVTETAQCISSSSGMVIGISSSSSSGQAAMRQQMPAAATAAAGVGTCSRDT
jgi:hypothetical protein